MSGRITARIIAGLGLAILAGCGSKDQAARRQAEVVPVTTQVVQTSAWTHCRHWARPRPASR